MSKKVVIMLNMFGPSTVFDADKEANVFSANVSDLIIPTLEYCKLKEYNDIHLYGDGTYGEGIKNMLLTEGTKTYGLNELNIEVN